MRADPSFVDHDLWPEFPQMDDLLTQCLGEMSEHIMEECINPDRSGADMVAGLPASDAAAERSG